MLKMLQNTKGSVTLIVALAMIVFLGLMAIVVDIGLLFLERNRLSNGVDAAALAGVQELPYNTSAAIIVARNYLERNLKDISDVQVIISNENKEVLVEAKKTVDFLLGPILGIHSREIQASARARTDVVAAVTGVVPIAVVRQSFVFGEQYMLKYGPGPGEGSYYRGNFGALALGNTGGSTYLENLAKGYQGILRIGDWVSTEPGDMAGPTAQGVRARIEADQTFSTYDNIAKGSTRLVVVPVVDSLEVSGRKEVKIVGFAAFFLESTSRRGNDSYIVGRFVRYATQGDIGSGQDFGLKAARLIE